jgi:hypothetical protein
VTDKPIKKRNAPLPKPVSAAENERPTVTPPFDVEAFAREATAPSEKPRPSSDAPTNRPPAHPAPPEFESEATTERITLTNEVELEKARAQSAIANAGPPRTTTSSALSIANARAPSSSNVPELEPDDAPPRNLSPSSIEAAVLGAIGGSSPPEITERTIEDPIAEMRERFSLGDYSGALEMSELILADMADNVEAIECGNNCRTVLENMYAARLGPLDRVPMVIVPRAQMRWLSMDHRAGFILSLIDGSSSVEMILDMSGMPRLDAYRILHELVQQKIVSFR